MICPYQPLPFSKVKKLIHNLSAKFAPRSYPLHQPIAFMKNILDQTRLPDITFYRSGLIRLSARVVRSLAIVPGDSINVAYGGGEYMLHAIHNLDCPGRHEATCYPVNKNGNHMCARSVRLSRRLLDMLSISDSRVSFAVGEPVDSPGGSRQLPIITLRPITK